MKVLFCVRHVWNFDFGIGREAKLACPAVYLGVNELEGFPVALEAIETRGSAAIVFCFIRYCRCLFSV